MHLKFINGKTGKPMQSIGHHPDSLHLPRQGEVVCLEKFRGKSFAVALVKHTIPERSNGNPVIEIVLQPMEIKT